MPGTRRSFIKGGLFGAAALATTAATGTSTGRDTSFEALNILVLGGTGFIGPHMVREALRRGHNVTLFNRGRTNSTLFSDLETIKGDRGGDLSGLKHRQFDAVVDNSGYVPSHVQRSAAVLSANISQYLFISTISTYASYATPNNEDSPLAAIDDETIEEVTGETYGPLKALCERRVRTEIGDDRLSILRPTYICGPGDHTDRFSYWPVRTARGGTMLWPGSPVHPIQIIDVRDLANFTIDCLDRRIMGVYNTVTPAGSYNMGSLLEDSQAVSGSRVDAVWADEAVLIEAEAASDVQNWGLIPVWHALHGDSKALSSISGDRAHKAGLHNRPVRETVRDLLSWWRTLPEERTTTMRAGMTLEMEQALIARIREAA